MTRIFTVDPTYKRPKTDLSKVKISHINLFGEVSIIGNIKKTETPQMAVSFGRHRKTGVELALKFYAQDLDRQTLNYERYAYEGVVYSHLSKTKYDTNIVRLVDRFIVDDREISAIMGMKSGKLGELGQKFKILKSLGNRIKIHVIITEKEPSARTLLDIGQTNEFTKERIRSCILQCLITLIMINRLGVQHNDFHYGNILMVTDPPEKSVKYNIDGMEFEIDMSHGKVLLFDWDFSYCQPCGENKILKPESGYYWGKSGKSLCQLEGACNSPNHKADMFLLLTQPHKDREYEAFRTRNLPPMVEKKYKRRGRMCSAGSTAGDCHPFPLGDPKDIRKLEDVIKDPYFMKLRARPEDRGEIPPPPPKREFPKAPEPKAPEPKAPEPKRQIIKPEPRVVKPNVIRPEPRMGKPMPKLIKPKAVRADAELVIPDLVDPEPIRTEAKLKPTPDSDFQESAMSEEEFIAAQKSLCELFGKYGKSKEGHYISTDCVNVSGGPLVVRILNPSVKVSDEFLKIALDDILDRSKSLFKNSLTYRKTGSSSYGVFQVNPGKIARIVFDLSK